MHLAGGKLICILRLEEMLLPILVLGLLFVRSFTTGIFPASKQQLYEREYGSICQLDRENSGEYIERFTRLASFVEAAAGDAYRQARHFKWGLKKWVLDRMVNTDYTNIA
nr:zinc finger, CCHC-type, retrotransposon Gag domain protein [Tanacetum cinerariifolium]